MWHQPTTKAMQNCRAYCTRWKLEEAWCTAYSKPKNRLDVPTMRKHVRQKMPDCRAIAWLQHDTWLWRQHHIQLVIFVVSLPVGPLNSHLLMPSQLLWQLPSVTTNHSSSSRGISNISLLQHTVKSSCQSVRLKTMTWLWKCKIKDCTLSKPQINEAHYWSHKF